MPKLEYTLYHPVKDKPLRVDGSPIRTTGKRNYSVIEPVNVFAFDYETYNPTNEIISLQIAGKDNSGYFEMPIAGEEPLKLFLDSLTSFVPGIFQSKRNRWLLFGHNLAFDFLRVVGRNNYSILYGQAIPDDTEIEIGPYKLLIKRGLYARVVFVDCKLTWGKSECQLSFRDTSAFFKTSLDKAAKDLGLPESLWKLPKPANLGEVDYRLINGQEKADFKSYAVKDAEITWHLGWYLASMHNEYQVHSRSGLTVSAPHLASSVFRSFIPSGKAILKPTKDIAQACLDSYKGGRTGGLARGSTKAIEMKVWAFDVVSMYPTAMKTIPNFLQAEYKRVEKYIEGVHGIYRISGRIRDTHYPAILYRNRQVLGGRLIPVVGDFPDMWVTSYELESGISWGDFERLSIHEGVIVVEGEEANNPLATYVDTFARMKVQADRDGNGALRFFAKLLLNSLYGKFVQTNGGFELPDGYDVIVPIPQDASRELRDAVLEIYRAVYLETGNVDEIAQEILGQYPEFAMSSLSDPELIAGGLFQPMIATLITGWSRARLHDLLHLAEGLYCDTDSVFTSVNPDSLAKKLASWQGYSSSFPFRIGKELGNLTMEGEGYLYIDKAKRYLLLDDAGEVVKKAAHAIRGRDKYKVLYDLFMSGRNSYKAQDMIGLRQELRKGDKDLSEVGKIVTNDYEIKDDIDRRLRFSKPLAQGSLSTDFTLAEYRALSEILDMEGIQL